MLLVIMALLALTFVAGRIAWATPRSGPHRAKALPSDIQRSAPGPHRSEPDHPLGPDDDPEFIRELARRRDSGTQHP
jgi:hypothetical protein